MKDGKSTSREQLIQELSEARKRISELEQHSAELKKIEKALRKSEQMFRLHFDNIRDVVYSLDRNFRIIDISPSVEKIAGYKPKELIGKPFYELDILAPEYIDKAFLDIEKVFTGEQIASSIYEFIIRDVGRIFADVSGSPLWLDGKVIGIVSVAKDITERKKAEQELLRKESELREAQRIAHIGSWYWNARTDATTGSDELLRIFGYNPEKQRMPSFTKQKGRCYPPESWQRLWEAANRTLQTGISCEVDVEAIRSATPIWVTWRGEAVRNENGEAIGLRGTVQDITYRKKAEEELQRHHDHLEELIKERTAELEDRNRKLEEEVTLRMLMNSALKESEAKYRSLTENINDIIWTADLDLHITYLSPSVEKVLGYSPDEYVKLEPWEIMTPESFSRVQEILVRELNREQDENTDPDRAVKYELESYHKDGSTVWVECMVNAIRDGKGNISGFHGVARDITDRKRAEEEKKKLENQLIQIQKIEALDRFAGGIAHDMNNILYPIIINTELLLSEALPDSIEYETLEQTLKAAYRQRDLIRQILAFSRKNDKKASPTKIIPLLKETIDFLRSSLPATIGIKYRIDAREDTIMADPTHIQQIIMNLCQNAADAMESQKGNIEVSLVNAHLESTFAHQEIRAGEYLQLTVKDTGHGMKPEVMDRIFEPFFTTRGIGQGTGMGLSVVHGIVKSHGGAITVESEEGKGSLFAVYLPLCDGASQAQAVVVDYTPSEHGSERILLVDDEEFILFSLQRALKNAGYHVVAFKSGLEALKLFKKKPDDFDVVITDLTMPGMTGLELSRKLLEIRSDIPVILCTGFNDAIDGDQAKALGIRELLLKPSGTNELKNIIRRALDISGVGPD